MNMYLRNIKYRVFIELQKHEWKFGRTRNTGRRRVFPQLFVFSHTFASVSISQLDYEHEILMMPKVESAIASQKSRANNLIVLVQF